jgi:transposase
MELHANAALTLPQRQKVRRLHREEGISIRKLAERFAANPTTIQRWVSRDSPLDRSTTPRKTHSTITVEYRSAVVAYRQAHPRHGPIRIAYELQAEFPMAHRGTVLKILQQEHLTRPPQAKPREHKPLPVGRHRVQMDVQQLPAIAGSKGFEYKISAIHMRTRLKYSEIHPTCTSELVAQVLRRAMDQLPPFF